MMDEAPIQSDRRKRILALISDAFGSGGGIAKFNRDLLTAASASLMASNPIGESLMENFPGISNREPRGIFNWSDVGPVKNV